MSYSGQMSPMGAGSVWHGTFLVIQVHFTEHACFNLSNAWVLVLWRYTHSPYDPTWDKWWQKIKLYVRCHLQASSYFLVLSVLHIHTSVHIQLGAIQHFLYLIHFQITSRTDTDDKSQIGEQANFFSWLDSKQQNALTLAKHMPKIQSGIEASASLSPHQVIRPFWATSALTQRTIRWEHQDLDYNEIKWQLTWCLTCHIVTLH